MIASLVLIAIGVADAARANRPRMASVIIGIASVLVVGIAAYFVLQISGWALISIVVVATLWVVCMPDDRARPRMWPIAVLAWVLAGLALVPTATESSPASDVLERASSSVLAEVSLATIVAALGVGLALTHTANIVARATLARVRPTSLAVAPHARRWRLRLGSWAIGSIERAEPTRAPAAEPQSTLRGGRLIGPIERLLIVALAMTGAYAVIAALVAAKGIVRFPEISADSETGSKAEEFLIGSLVSWGLAALGALWIWIAQNGL